MLLLEKARVTEEKSHKNVENMQTGEEQTGRTGKEMQQHLSNLVPLF